MTVVGIAGLFAILFEAAAVFARINNEFRNSATID